LLDHCTKLKVFIQPVFQHITENCNLPATAEEID